MFKKWQKIFLSIFLPLSVGSLSVGFAAISDNLAINGIVNSTPPKEIFITEVVKKEGEESASLAEPSYSGTTLSSRVDLSKGTNNKVSYYVTVLNNIDPIYGDDINNQTTYGYFVYSVPTITGVTTYSNENITITVYYDDDGKDTEGELYDTRVPDLPKIDKENNTIESFCVGPGEDETFRVEFSVKEGLTDEQIASLSYELESIVSYEFRLLTEFPEHEGEVATSAVLDKFAEILNSTEKNAEGKTPIDRIFETMDANGWFGMGGGDFVGNVDENEKEDYELIEELFSDSLTLNINGSNQEVKMIIKKEDVDGNSSTGDSGDEMTLYMTTDPLTDTRIRAVVYAVVFTKDSADGEWYQLSPILEGYADVWGYSGLNYNGTGSFSTDYWSTDPDSSNAGDKITDLV